MTVVIKLPEKKKHQTTKKTTNQTHHQKTHHQKLIKKRHSIKKKIKNPLIKATFPPPIWNLTLQGKEVFLFT